MGENLWYDVRVEGVYNVRIYSDLFFKFLYFICFILGFKVIIIIVVVVLRFGMKYVKCRNLKNKLLCVFILCVFFIFMLCYGFFFI